MDAQMVVKELVILAVNPASPQLEQAGRGSYDTENSRFQSEGQ